MKAIYETPQYVEYIEAILARAKIVPECGKVSTRITYEEQIPILRNNNCATVNQEFQFTKDTTIELGGITIEFRKDIDIITVIYSKKYTGEALKNLIKCFFGIVESFYLENEYALILSKKL